MAHGNSIFNEFVSAITVIAVFCLSFLPSTELHANDAQQIYEIEIAAFSFCGDAPDQNHSAHAPCHACRPAILGLPPCGSNFVLLDLKLASLPLLPLPQAKIQQPIVRDAAPRAPPPFV